MTINNWLVKAQKSLKEAGVTSYSLDALLLLEHTLNLERAHLLAHQDQSLTQGQIGQLSNLLSRRIKREPIAYLTNKNEFYGNDFYVDKNVLIPRPESEAIVELALSLPKDAITLLDVGCGSGVLGISIKLTQPRLDVILSDISTSALKIAHKNALNLDADVTFKQTNLLENMGKFDVVVANLPYVPNQLKLEPELAYEPAIALFADTNGMSLYEKFWSTIKDVNPSYVITESLAIQHAQMIELADNAGYRLSNHKNLAQLFIKT